jgi:hypothetical protein
LKRVPSSATSAPFFKKAREVSNEYMFESVAPPAADASCDCLRVRAKPSALVAGSAEAAAAPGAFRFFDWPWLAVATSELTEKVEVPGMSLAPDAAPPALAAVEPFATAAERRPWDVVGFSPSDGCAAAAAWDFFVAT